MRPFARIFIGVVILLSAQIAAQQRPAPPQTPVFRGVVSLVPLDVRVVDQSGRPVTDLKEGDFSIRENGAPQAIRHFSTRMFTPEPAAAGSGPDFRTGQTPELGAGNRRIFLLVLGRGRHQAVSKYVDALAAFVGKRINPQDYVAVLAWNRAIDFTTDKKLVTDLLVRYRDRAQRIEHDLSQWFRGLQALYGPKDIPRHIQTQIDDVFAGAASAALRPRPLAPASITDAARIDEDVRQTAENLRRVAEIEDRLKAGFRSVSDPHAARGGLPNLSFDEYVIEMTETLQDVGNLYAGIGYLRLIEGEKHLVLLTERGVSLPDQDGNRSLARVASDARIALDFIQTGGVSGTTNANGLPSAGASFAQTFAMLDLRVMAEKSGGQVIAFRTGEDSFRRLDEGMKFQYLLGYAPSNPERDGTFRRVAVTVNRPGLRVIVREGYFAVDTPVILDRREMVTFSRIRAAAEYYDVVDHLKLTLGKPAVTGSGLSVDVTVDISRLKLAASGEEQTATLDVALFCGDEKDQPVCDLRRQVELRLDPAALSRARNEGATFRLSAPVKGQVRKIKLVVYDYGADLIGSAIARVGR